jgi:hypothetical protein
MKVVLKFLPLFSIFLINMSYANFKCKDLDDSSGKVCFYPKMKKYNQRLVDADDVNPSTACGPSAFSTLIDLELSLGLLPKEGGFIEKNFIDKDLYTEKIPNVYKKLKTSQYIGTMPWNINSKGFLKDHYLQKMESFSIYGRKVHKLNHSQYVNWIRNRYRMLHLIGFWKKKCINFFGVKKCYHLVPQTLHYVSNNGFYDNKLRIHDNDKLKITKLSKIKSGCVEYKQINGKKVCKESVSLPMFRRKMRYFKKYSHNSTFVHGVFGRKIQ